MLSTFLCLQSFIQIGLEVITQFESSNTKGQFSPSQQLFRALRLSEHMCLNWHGMHLKLDSGCVSYWGWIMGRGGVWEGMSVTACQHVHGMYCTFSMYCMYSMYVSACLQHAQTQSSFCSGKWSIVTLILLLCESFICTAEYCFFRL